MHVGLGAVPHESGSSGEEDLAKLPQQQQLQASSMADQIPTFEQLSTRRPSIVSLQNTTESLETGQTARGPSPVSAALGNHMPARHPADHETNDNEEEDRTQEFDTQSVPLQGHGACGQEATPPPSFQESQNALTRNNRTLSSPPMPSSPIRTQVQRSSSVASHLSTSSPRSSSASSAVFLSVANSALARLSADAPQGSAGQQNRRSFFGNLLRRSQELPPSSNSQSQSSLVSTGFVSHQTHGQHTHTQSSPTADIYAGPDPNCAPGQQPFMRPSPASVGIGINMREPLPNPPEHTLLNTTHSLDDGTRADAEVSIEDIGLQQRTMTSSMSLSRHGQPLCGTVLDDEFLLIGTTSGLDFLPLKADHLNLKKPLSLVKRTRFKQLAILKERSNVLLAVAGRNDHVRVYALDGIRAMIDRKMKELNNPSFARTIVNVASGNSNSTSSAASRDKGKARAKPPPMNLSPSTPLGSAIQTKGPLTPPPPYIQRHGASQGSATSSPTRSRGSSTVASVRTRPSNADLRSPPPGALSPDSAARRRSSAATVVPAASLPVSPGFQQQSPHLRVTRSVDEDDQNETEDTETTDADTEDELDNIDRSSRETGDSDWEQQRASPFTPSPSRMMARSASVQHSSPSALIQFLRDTEPPVTSNGSPSRSPPSSSRRPDLARSSSLDPTSRHPGPVSQDTEDGQRIPRRRSSRPTLMARPASRVENSTAQDIVKFLEGVSPPPPPPRRRPRENLSATDSQTQTTPATNNSVTTIFQNEDQGDLQQNRASSLPKLSPRPASFAGTSTDMRELAAFLREGPESSSPSRPPSASFAAARRAATSSPIPEEEFRPASRLSATSSDQPQSSSLQPTSRGRKRWSGMLENVLRGTSSPPISQMPHSSSAPSLIDEEQHEMSQSTPEQSTSAPPVPTSRPGLTRRGSTQKLRSPELGEDNSEELSSDGLPSVDPAAVSVPPTKTDKHPASSAAPLEYVKLARTKGTRLIKSIETQKRTFLAVLCGDSGERIELFTGSKNVSLSLNRTFVLPESPRTIEFQLQGEELVDIYLVYDESIFALEPTTVRVREVGVGRHERRAARRERERQQAAQAVGTASSSHMPSASTGEIPEDTLNAEDIANQPDPTSTNTNEATNDSSTPLDGLPQPSAEQGQPQPEQPAFSTFQQLMYIPPVPASVLAPAYVIPPTYSSVIQSNPMPEQAEQHSGPSSSSPPTRLHNPDAPLLSPISLLANHPATSNGPPGLFYVSRGKASTNIVDADGRSVIRKAIHWRDDTNSLIEAGSDPDTLRALHVWHRIEVLLSPSGRTIMVGIGATEIQAVEMGPLGDSSNAIVIPDSAAKRRLKPVDAWDSLRDVVYLGSLGSRIFWSERVGNQTQLHCLETLH